jgi:hypothetical protein
LVEEATSNGTRRLEGGQCQEEEDKHLVVVVAVESGLVVVGIGQVVVVESEQEVVESG